MKSMTGFGRGQASFEGGHVLVELRSVNHRYLDVRLTLPPELTSLEGELDRRLRPRLQRGRIDGSVQVIGRVVRPLRLDRDAARGVFEDLQALREELGLDEPVSISLLASIPGLFVEGGDLEDGGLYKALTEALESAFDSLEEMRRREGASLEADFQARLAELEKLVGELREGTAEAAPRALERLEERLRVLLSDRDITVDESRMIQELALLAGRYDVSEELTRLASHIEQFSLIMAEDGPIGKRLDFLLQEMSRETSTLAAKVQEAELKHLAVDLRGEIARMREQVQNIE